MNLLNERKLDVEYEKRLPSSTIDKTIFFIFLYCILIFIPSKDEFDSILDYYFWLYTILQFQIIHNHMQPYLTVIEGGKVIWIFEKYRFAPTSIRRLCLSKLILLAKFCCMQLIITLIAYSSSLLLLNREFNSTLLLWVFINLINFTLESLRISYHGLKTRAR